MSNKKETPATKATRKKQAKGKGSKKDRQGKPTGPRGKGKATPNDDIEKAWWMTCWLDKDLRLYRAPIASRLTDIAGSHESKSNILVLSSAYNLPLRVGESLDYLAMKAFASASMLSPSGKNNRLPHATGNEFVEIHTDSSAKTNVLGISAVFSVRECSYSYAGGMIVDSNLLIFNYGEFVAAVSAMLVAISRGYRHILVSTDSESLVRTWAGEETGTPSENVDRQLLALKDIVASQGYSVSVRHVKGHGIDFSNTMADGLAEMGYARSSMTSRDLDAFGYQELRQAYDQTIRLNERLEGMMREMGRLPSHATQSGDALGQERLEEQREPAETALGPADASEGAGQSANQSANHGNHGTPQDAGASRMPPAGESPSAGDDQREISPDRQPEQAAPQAREADGTPGTESPQGHATGGDAREGTAEPPVTAPSPARQRGGRDHPSPRRGRRAQAQQPRSHSLSINQPTVEICRLLNRQDDHVSVNRVDRLVAGGAIEKWDTLNDDPACMTYARNLVSGGGLSPDNRIMDAIWDALAKNVARKVARKYSSQKKRSPLVMRTMLVARICGVSIEPSIDYVMENMRG